MPQTIFITGTSTGLGRATALLFAQKGWSVIATMRSPEKETELTNIPGITVLKLDVSDPAQIDAVVRSVLALGPVDVVFNNAGYALAGPFEAATDDQLTSQINTNLLGVLRTTKAFIPSFRESRAGIFITTTSIGGHVTLPLNSVYHATKFALEGWSESLAFELEPFGIHVKTVAPGGIKNDFLRAVVFTAHPFYDHLVQKVLAVFTDPESAANHSTSEQVAEVVYEAATDGKAQVSYLAGIDAKALVAQRLTLGAEAARRQIAQLFLG